MNVGRDLRYAESFGYCPDIATLPNTPKSYGSRDLLAKSASHVTCDLPDMT